MRFVKAIWKLLVGIKDGLVLILMLMFFGALYAGLKARPAPIGEGVLMIDLAGTLVEQPSSPGAAELLSGMGSRIKEHRLRDLVAALDEAKDDERVKAVALDLDGFIGGGQAAIGELGEAVARVRASGKPVLAYATGYADDGYLLASHASEIWVNPLGAVAIAGPGGSNLYLKGLMDKLGVTANVYRVGTYKSAIEPYTRSDMSPEAKDNARALGEALLESWRDTVAKARPKAAAGVARYIADPVAAIEAAQGDFARAASDLALVDKAGERRTFEARLAELGGSDDEGGYRKIKLSHYIKGAVDTDPEGPIGVITVAGDIVDGEAGPGIAGGESIAEAIESGLRDEAMKALVVRVDSGGGSVLASERIRQAILAAKERGLPVVVSMGNVAASGGYWVATPADFIFAEPSTITGSIGVFGILPSFEGTLAKLGVGADGIKTTPLSGEPNLLAGPSPEADRMIQAGVESIYRRFLSLVSVARKKSPAEIDRIAQGRVWDGGTARQLGLVDGFGGLDEAVAKAAALAKLGDERGVRYLERPTGFAEELLAMFAGEDEGAAPADALARLGPAPEALVAQLLGEVRSILSGPSIQVRCLECPPSAPARRVSASEAGFVARLLAG